MHAVELNDDDDGGVRRRTDDDFLCLITSPMKGEGASEADCAVARAEAFGSLELLSGYG